MWNKQTTITTTTTKKQKTKQQQKNLQCHCCQCRSLQIKKFITILERFITKVINFRIFSVKVTAPAPVNRNLPPFKEWGAFYFEKLLSLGLFIHKGASLYGGDNNK